jgi:hypothetical protein
MTENAMNRIRDFACALRHSHDLASRSDNRQRRATSATGDGKHRHAIQRAIDQAPSRAAVP